MLAEKEENEQRPVYESRPKQFGEVAQRISKEEFDQIFNEIKAKCRGQFARLEHLISLKDKETFGDMDLVVISDVPKEEEDSERFREIFGENLISYRYQKNDNMDSILLKLDSGKIVQVDFVRVKDETDFEAKIIHGSKGQSSSAIGFLAKAYGYKFAIDGFYKRYTDSKGNQHDVLVTKDLRKAMQMMGIDPAEWDNAEVIDDIVSLVAASPFFKPELFLSDKLNSKNRNSIRKRSVQDYVLTQLQKRPATTQDPLDKEAIEKYIQQNFPKEYENCVQNQLKIETQVPSNASINGHTIMEAFNLRPGSEVGKILSIVKANFPDATELNDEIATFINKYI